MFYFFASNRLLANTSHHMPPPPHVNRTGINQSHSLWSTQAALTRSSSLSAEAPLSAAGSSSGYRSAPSWAQSPPPPTPSPPMPPTPPLRYLSIDLPLLPLLPALPWRLTQIGRTKGAPHSLWAPSPPTPPTPPSPPSPPSPSIPNRLQAVSKHVAGQQRGSGWTALLKPVPFRYKDLRATNGTVVVECDVPLTPGPIPDQRRERGQLSASERCQLFVTLHDGMPEQCGPTSSSEVWSSRNAAARRKARAPPPVASSTVRDSLYLSSRCWCLIAATVPAELLESSRCHETRHPQVSCERHCFFRDGQDLSCAI